MKYIYPALFTREDNGYSVVFPDLESCYTQGDSLDDAYDMAADILCLTLYNLEEKNKEIPRSSDPKKITVKEESFVSLVQADTIDYRKYYDNRAVKKTLTIPSWLNVMAERNGVNFSAVLQNGLKQQLNIFDHDSRM